MELEEEAQEITPDRIPCQFCTRKFVPESLAKHAKVCEKMSLKKRKTFDSAKQRIQGTELAEFLPVVVSKKNDIMTSSQYKEKSSVPVIKVIDTVHHVPSRKVNKVTSPMSKSSNYEKCPYCDRSFGPKAFDRHIEWCKEQSIRINLKSSATQEAKERLEARTKYRAPSFKSKRSITREKYSPKVNHQDNHSSFSNRIEARKDKEEIRPFELEPKIKSKSLEKLKPKEKETNFIRQNVLRCSYRGKLPKKAETKAEKDTLNNNFQNEKKPEYNVVQDWISANGTKIKPMPQQTSKMSVNCVNKPLINMMCDTYNPYILAEHQMKELLNVNANLEPQPLNQTFTIAKLDTSNSPLPKKDELRNNFHNKENISYDHNGPVKTISCQTDVADKSEKYFKTSPTSAFTKYSNDSPEMRTPTPIPSYDYDKQDDHTYLPPIKHEAQSNHDTNMNRYPLISLSNLSLCSSVSIDIPEDRNKLCKSADKPRNTEVQLAQRSISACADKGKNAVKKNLKMEHLLYGNTESKEANSTSTTDTYSSKYDEKLDKLNSLLDGENFDLLHSFTEFENVLQNSCFDDTFTTSTESNSDKRNLKFERGDSMVSKMSADSAYNSLNRKSPALSESHKYYGKTSTPDTDTLKSSTFSLTSDFQESQMQKFSKFCHDCGARYPLDIAKFCCECGVRRLVL